MPIDPHIILTTSGHRQADADASLNRRMAAFERGGGGSAVGGTVSGEVINGPLLTPTSNTSGAPQWGRVGFGVAPASGVTVNLGSTAITDKVVQDEAHGILIGDGVPGLRWNIYHGGGTPVTAEGSTLRISRYSSYPSAVVNGASGYRYAAFQVWHRVTNTSHAQPMAAVFHALNDSTQTPLNPAGPSPSTNTDANGIQSFGRILGAGTGSGFGITTTGSTVSTVPTSGAVGIEVDVTNGRTGAGLGADSVAAGGIGTGSRTMGIWLHTGQSTAPVAAGIQFGRQAGNQPFHTGIYFTAAGAQGNPVSDASFRDDGNASRAIYIKGTHADAAIGIADGSGHVGIGTTFPSYPLHISKNSSGPTAYFANLSANPTNVFINSVVGQQALVNYGEAGTVQWQAGMQATGNEYIVNDAIGGYVATSITSNEGTRVIRSKNMTDPLIQDTTHGDIGSTGGYAGQRWSMYHGTAAAPVTTDGAAVRISQFRQDTVAVTNGADYEKYSTLAVTVRGSTSTKARPIAIVGVAHSDSTQTYNAATSNTDALGVQGHGKVTGSGTGRGIGGVFTGEFTSTSARASGLEVSCWNDSAADSITTSSGSDSMGLWLSAKGSFQSAAAIQIGKSGGTWDCGIYVTGAGSQGDAVVNSTFRDDGVATTSLDIRGTHTDALKIASGAGAIGVTATATGRSATAGLHITNAGVVSISRSTSAAQVYLQCYSSSDGTNTATRFGIQSNADGSVRLRFGDGTGTINELYKVFGSSIIKTSHQFEVASILTVGSTLAHNGTQLGFYAKTPINQPTALTARDNTVISTTLYGAAEAAVIDNIRTRLNELESRVNANATTGLGLIAGTA